MAASLAEDNESAMLLSQDGRAIRIAWRLGTAETVPDAALLASAAYSIDVSSTSGFERVSRLEVVIGRRAFEAQVSMG